jgi:hypothetical protein
MQAIILHKLDCGGAYSGFHKLWARQEQNEDSYETLQKKQAMGVSTWITESVFMNKKGFISRCMFLSMTKLAEKPGGNHCFSP